MKLNMIRVKNQTEDLLLSITKNCETFVEQTHRKAEDTLEFKMIKPRKKFHFNPPISIKRSSMIELTDLEVYNSVFNITEANNKVELYIFPDEKAGGISYTKVRDEIERDLDISDITVVDLQDDVKAPINIEDYREQVTKGMEGVGYMNFLSGYPRSVSQDFESYLRTEIDLVGDEIRLVLDTNNSSFSNYEVDPGINTFEDVSESVFNILQTECPSSNSKIIIEFDDITMKIKLFEKSVIIAMRFDEKLFFNTVFGFNHGWDYKHYNEYTSQKNCKLK